MTVPFSWLQTETLSSTMSLMNPSIIYASGVFFTFMNQIFKLINVNSKIIGNVNSFDVNDVDKCLCFFEVNPFFKSFGSCFHFMLQV